MRRYAGIISSLVLTAVLSVAPVQMAMGEDAAQLPVEAEGQVMVLDEAEQPAPQEPDAGDEETEEGAPSDAGSTNVVADTSQTADEETDAVELYAQATLQATDAYAAAHEGTVADGTYCITTSLNDAYSFDVRGGTTKYGAQIILYKAKVSQNQRWEIHNVGGGYVTIRAAASKRYLQIEEAKGGTKLVQGDTEETGDRRQLWIVAREDDGTYSFTSGLNSSYVLNVRHGAKALVNDHPIEIIAYRRNATLAANERWTLQVTQDILDSEAAAHAGDLADGLYLVASASNASKVLDLRRASLNNGARIIAYAKTPAINQVWKVSHDASGYATIVSAWSGKALDVRGGKAADGAEIIQWTAKTNARNQQWIIAQQQDGSYSLTSALTSWRYVFDLNGSVGVLREAQLAANQGRSWTFEAAPEQLVHYYDIEDGTYFIKTALNETKNVDKTLDASAKTKYVNLWDASGSKNQLWKLTHDKQGFVHLTNVRDNLELGYAAGRTVESGESSRWIVKDNGNGRYVIAYGDTGKVLDVSRSSTANGAKVITYRSTGAVNQQWLLVQDYGFVTIDGEQYLQDSTGKNLTGIRTVNGKKFYFDPDQKGALAKGGVLLEGASRTVYVNPDTRRIMSGLPLDKNRYVVAWDGVLHQIPARGSKSTTAYSKEVAAIVAQCVAPAGKDSNYNRVHSASKYVFAFIGNGDRSRYTIDWNTSDQFVYAYGPFSFGYYSCGGCTDALTMILQDMGIQAESIVNNGATHSYTSVVIDGRRAWVDGQVAMLSYTLDGVHNRF